MNTLQHRLSVLARDVSDVEDTHNPRVLAKYPHLDSDALRAEIYERIKAGYKALDPDDPRLAAAGIVLAGKESAVTLREYAAIAGALEERNA